MEPSDTTDAANAWAQESPSVPYSAPTLAVDSPSFAPPPRSSFWFGPAGLRAGWSLCLYFLIILATAIVVGIVVGIGYIILHSDQLLNAQPHHRTAASRAAKPTLWYTMLGGEILGIGILLFASWMMSLIERRPYREYGLGATPFRGRQLLAGMFWGFAAFALLIGILYACGAIAFDGVALSGASIATYGIAWLLTFGSVGFLEEILFRGYLQYTLARGLGHRGWGFWIAAILLSFGFCVVHMSNKGETPVGIFEVGVIGLVFCFSLWYTRSLWWAIGFHAIWDWAESYFWGTADSGILIKGHLLATHPRGNPLISGGATGPEGSIVVFPLCLLIVALIYFTLRQERNKSATQSLINPEPQEILGAQNSR